MDKIQIECPNCGATLQASQLAEIECPYCGSKFTNPLNEEKNATVIESIIPFSMSGDDFKERLYENFIDKTQVPQDIFEHLEIQWIGQYYLPMYLFTGEYHADWSCTVVYRQKDKQGNEYEDCRPASGVATGHFAKLALACNSLPEKMTSFIEVIDQTSEIHSATTDYMPSYLVGEDGSTIEVASIDISDKDAWNGLHPSIKEDAENAAYSQMRMGSATRDNRISVNFKGDLRDLLLFPIWYGEYTYQGEEYHFVMDGRGSSFDFSHPYDSDYRDGVLVRFFTMFGMLGLTTIVSGIAVGWSGGSIAPTMVVAAVAFIFLSIRHIIEYYKFTKDIKANKRVSKAKFCNEEIPGDISSSNSAKCKRNNKILTWIAIGLVAAIGILNAVSTVLGQKRREQIEQTKHEHFELVVKTINSPDMFFHTSTEEYGHLRQDLGQQLFEMGFEKASSRYSGSEAYTLRSSMAAQTISVSLHKNDELSSFHSNYTNKDDSIKYVEIKVDGISDFVENFIAALTKHHFVLEKEIAPNLRKKMPYSLGEVYVRVGNNFRKEKREYFSTTTVYYADWDAAVIGNGKIELYSRNETQEVSDVDLSAGLTFRTFTEKATEDNIVYQSRLAGEQVAKNLKELGFELVKSETKSRYNHIDEVYYDAAIDTYTKTANGNTTTVIYDEAGSTKIIFPTFDDAKAFEKTIKECGLQERDGGYEDAKEIYWAGTDVYIDGKTVILHYKTEA